MKISKSGYLFIMTVFLAVYYLFLGIYVNKLGYYSPEALFYIEKARIVFEGIGLKLKVIGLTSPLLPFYGTFAFTSFNTLLAPILASAIGTAVLFYLIANTLAQRLTDDFYLIVLLVLFLFHPGLLYTACSGKGIYLTLIFFYLFFLNIFKYYDSNTTFHISISSICLVLLVFSNYKFIWLTLFFLPLVFSIAIHSLNLGEKESIFRISISFNNPSLRRKLINKTFAIYIILFILPLASIICYKLLNLTNANDLNYFSESPYATWTVLAERLSFEKLTASPYFKIPDTSLLITAKVLMFCPLMFLAIYLFRDKNYQILSLITPFALLEFLHIKYEKVTLGIEYYLIFIVLSLLAIVVKAQTIRNQLGLKTVLVVVVAIQLFAGYYFINNSAIDDEKKFITILKTRVGVEDQDENKDVANFINSLPESSRILIDDAIAYPVVTYIRQVKNLTLPYQENFLTAIETPWNYDNYILVATRMNPTSGYTILNDEYGPIHKLVGRFSVQKVYETDNWTLYHILR